VVDNVFLTSTTVVLNHFTDPDLRFCWRAAQKILPQVNWHVLFYCTSDICYAKY